MKTPTPSALLALALAGLATAPALLAQTAVVPERLSYQGNVSDASGNPIGASQAVNRKVHFKIYDSASGGSALYAEDQTVTISAGEFSVAIGNGAGVSGVPGPSAPASTPYVSIPSVLSTPGKSYYLGITIDDGDGNIANDTEIAPRQQLLSGAFALRAKTAEAVTSGAVTSAMLQDGEIAAADLGANAVITAKIQDAAVNSAKIADASVATADLSNSSVTKEKINTSSVGLWDVNGSSVYRPSGFVGIGTASPAYPLDVSGNATTEASLRGQAAAQLRIEDTGDASTYWLRGDADRLYLLWNGGTGATSWQGTYPMVFKDAFTGLGTENPATRLHVMGEATIEDPSAPNLRLKYTGGNGTQLASAPATGLFASNAARGDGVLRSLDGGLHLLSGNGVSALQVQTDNWLAIGRGLSFTRNSSDGAPDNDFAKIYLEYLGSNNGRLVLATGDDNDEPISMRIGATERFRVQNWGVEAWGSIRSSGSRNGSPGFADMSYEAGDPPGNAQAGCMLFRVQNSSQGGSATKHVAWDGDGNWDFESDARLKENIHDAEPMLERLLAVKVRRFDWKNSGIPGQQLGVVAQEVREVFPDIVSTYKFDNGLDETFTVGYDSFGLIAVKGLQELHGGLVAELDEKDRKIGELEKRIEKLEALIQSR